MIYKKYVNVISSILLYTIYIWSTEFNPPNTKFNKSSFTWILLQQDKLKNITIVSSEH
jgi:hypothetical protein